MITWIDILPTVSCFRTAIGLRVKDGVVLALEKLVSSKLLVPGTNRRIQTVDRHIGIVRAVPFLSSWILISAVLCRIECLCRLPQVYLQMVVTSHPEHLMKPSTIVTHTDQNHHSQPSLSA